MEPPRTLLEPEDICSGEWAEWYRLIPLERWEQSQQLWATYLALEAGYLRHGHAVHFRCGHPEAAGLRVDIMAVMLSLDGFGESFQANLRVDIMAVMRGVAPFPELWERRTTLTTPAGQSFDLLALPDLVQAKKTQRDKDWPMLRRLLEVHYFEHRDNPSEEQASFWLRELRTPILLLELAQTHSRELAILASEREVLAVLHQGGDEAMLEAALDGEEHRERERDRRYWQPLKTELERLRHLVRA